MLLLLYLLPSLLFFSASHHSSFIHIHRKKRRARLKGEGGGFRLLNSITIFSLPKERINESPAGGDDERRKRHEKKLPRKTGNIQDR